MQHHSLQPWAFHNRQWHVTLNNHQNKILNEPHLNWVRFFVKIHTSKKMSDGYKHEKCFILTFLSFTAIFAL
jgi:hypothetical protein